MKDYFSLAARSLKTRKTRSWLTILGIFIGIAAVVAVISLGQGFQKAIEDQFSALGGDKLFIQPRGQFGPPGSTTVGGQLTTDDVDTVRRVHGVQEVSYFTGGNARLVFNDQVRFYLIAGIPLDQGLSLLLSFYKMESGRFLKSGDRKKVVIGSYYAHENIFIRNVQLRDRIEINGEEFQVVGILKPIGNPGDDSILLIPEEDLKELFDVGERVDNIIVQTLDEPERTAERISDALRRERNVEKGKEDFFLLTPEGLLTTFQNVFLIVQVFIVGIAAISLLVGGIGIMNTMYTSVLERTREIGIMKAIGARNRDVLIIFLIESGLLGVIGGTLGILIGTSLALGVEYLVTTAFSTTLLQAYFPWYLIVGSLLFSFILGAISGVLPAMQASKMKPVDALRYE